MIVCRGLLGPDPPRTAGPLPGPGGRGAARHRRGMAEQVRRAPAIVRELAGKELTHRALDELPAGKSSSCAASPARYRDAAGTRRADEQAGTLDRLGHRRVPRPRPAATAVPLRRLARDPPAARPARRFACHPQLGRGSPAAHQGHCRAAGLAVRPRLDLAHRPARRPGDRLASPQATHRADAGNFVRWARKQKLTGLDFAATRWSAPASVIHTEARWEQARRLLHDGTLKPEDRVAGQLVRLYAQWPATISQLTLGHVQAAVCTRSASPRFDAARPPRAPDAPSCSW